MTTFPFDLTDLIGSLFDCLGVDTQNDKNLLASLLQSLIESIIEIFGSVAVSVAKAWRFVTEGALSLINECIEELSELISDPYNWLFSKINRFENCKTPVPEIPLGILDIVIPANKAYRDLVAQYDISAETLSNKFAVIVTAIVSVLTSGFQTVLSYVTDLINLLTTINIDNIVEKIQELVGWFASLVAPVIKVVDGWLEGLIGLFVRGATEINRIKNELYDFVVGCLTGAIPFTNESLDTLDISVHPLIKTIARFVICFLKFIVEMIIFLFSFSWL